MTAAKELNFLELVQTFRRGELLHQADDMLNELVEAIRATGGNGTLTLSMPFKTNKAGQIECTPKIKAEKPRNSIGTGIFYASDDGRLTRNDPNQPDMIDEIERRRAKPDH